MAEIRKKLIKLIDVKSLVTLILTATFSLLSLAGKITEEQFQSVFTTVIAFYFGIQYQKNSKEEENDSDFKKR